MESLTANQKQAISEAIDYIVTVTDKQGRLIDCKSLFGDGSRFPLLKRKGFEAVYQSVKDTLIEKQILVKAL